MISCRNFVRNRRGIGTVFATVFFLLIVMVVFGSFVVILNQNTDLQQTISQSTQIDNEKANEQLSITGQAIYSNPNTVEVSCALNNTGMVPIQLIRLWVKDQVNNNTGTLSLRDPNPIILIQQGRNWTGSFSVTVTDAEPNDSFVFWFVTERGNRFSTETNGGTTFLSETIFNEHLSSVLGDFLPDYNSVQWAFVNTNGGVSTSGPWQNGWVIPTGLNNQNLAFKLNMTYYGKSTLRVDNDTNLIFNNLQDRSVIFEGSGDGVFPTLYITNFNSVTKVLSSYNGNEISVEPSTNPVPITLYFSTIQRFTTSGWSIVPSGLPVPTGYPISSIQPNAMMSLVLYGMSPSNYAQTFSLFSVQSRPINLQINTLQGPVGTSVTAIGTGFGANSGITLKFDSTQISIPSTNTDSNGYFTVLFNVPASTAGLHTVTATDSSISHNAAAATFTVTPLVTITPTRGISGTQITISGQGYAANSYLIMKFNADSVSTSPVSPITNELGSFSNVVFTAQSPTIGPKSVNVTDANGNWNATTFNMVALDHFTITGQPASITAGQNFGANNIVVSARDIDNNLIQGYVGQVYFASTDSQATLPYTFTNTYTFTGADQGSHSFSGNGFTLRTAGSQSITVTDGLKSGTSSQIVVNPSTAVSLTVTGYPSSVTAGTSGTATVTAKDAFGNTATGYRGTVHLTSTDAAATLPGDHAFTSGNNGVYTFTGIILKTAGSQSITATDTVTPSITGTQASITVTPGSLDHFTLSGYPAGSVTAGQSFSGVTVRAYDLYNNLKTDFTGQVYFTSTDAQATLPYTSGSRYTFTSGAGADNGVKVFDNFALKTVGSRTITVTDGSKSATSNAITVNPASLDHFDFNSISNQLTNIPFSITVTALDLYGNTATSYSGTNTLSASVGAINPATTTSFTAGTWTGQVSLNQIGAGITITTTGGGHSGTSNAFTVANPATIQFRTNGMGGDTGSASIVTIDSTTYTYAQLQTLSFQWATGSTHTINAVSPVAASAGKQYAWTSWSDAGTQSHTYTVPGSDATVTVNYKTQYQCTFSRGNLGSDATGAVLTVGTNTYTYAQLPQTGIWVDANTAYSYTATVTAGAGKQYVLTGTTGLATPIVAAGTATPTYKAQYAVTFDQSGLDSSATGTVLTVGTTTYTYAQLPQTSIWVDSGTTYSYTTSVSAGTAKTFGYTSITGPASPITATGTVTGRYGSLILRPNAAGTTTSLSVNTGSNYAAVDETSADGDSTYVYRTSASWAGDTYGIPDTTLNGLTIESITVHVVARDQSSYYGGNARGYIRIGSTNYNCASSSTLTTSYAEYTYNWATNPNTNAAWTWANINSLEVGVQLYGYSSTYQARCTQVWLEITYTA